MAIPRAGHGMSRCATEAARVVVDDEQLARDELCFLLGQVGGVEIVGQAATASRPSRRSSA